MKYCLWLLFFYSSSFFAMNVPPAVLFGFAVGCNGAINEVKASTNDLVSEADENSGLEETNKKAQGSTPVPAPAPSKSYFRRNKVQKRRKEPQAKL